MSQELSKQQECLFVCLYRIYSIAAMHKMTTELISIYIKEQEKAVSRSVGGLRFFVIYLHETLFFSILFSNRKRQTK